MVRHDNKFVKGDAGKALRHSVPDIQRNLIEFRYGKKRVSINVERYIGESLMEHDDQLPHCF